LKASQRSALHLASKASAFHFGNLPFKDSALRFVPLLKGQRFALCHPFFKEPVKDLRFILWRGPTQKLTLQATSQAGNLL